MSKLNLALGTVVASLLFSVVALNNTNISANKYGDDNIVYIDDSEQASMMGVGGNDSGHSGSVTQPSHSSSTASSSVSGNTTKPSQSNTNGNTATQPSKVAPNHSSSTASSTVNGSATKPSTVKPSAPKNNNSSSSHKSSAAKPSAPIHNVTKPSQTKPAQSVKNGWVDGVYYNNNATVSGYVQAAPGGANGGYLWLENGRRFTGFRFYMGTYYWFNNGVRQNAGWRSAWGFTYYTDANGRAVQGNYIVNGQAYNFGSDGTFFLRGGVSGYVDAGQGWKWYDNGSKFTGFRFYMGTYYWFTNGVRQDNGWRTAWGLKYYTDNTGRAVQGWQNIDGKSYYFGDNGTFFLR